MHNIRAQEAKVNLGCDLLINALVDVVALVGGLGLAALEVLVELVVVFEEQEEDFVRGVDDGWDVAVAHWDLGGFECARADEHAF